MINDASHRSTQVQEVRIRIAGQIDHRIDVTHSGTEAAMAHLMLGSALLRIGHRCIARKLVETWRAARVWTHRLPEQAPQQLLGSTHGVGPVSVILTLGSHVEVTGHLAPNEHTRRPEILIGLGPITWCVIDRQAYTAGLVVWQQIPDLLGP
jgi:hypothetical protein